jgi:hypothetical protein
MRNKSAPKKTARSIRNVYRSKKVNYRRGALGAGTAYGLLALLVLMSAGSLMIGSIAPRNKSPQDGQVVVIATNTPQPQKNNLQLYTFPGATYTPTPSPTPQPQPQQNDSNGSGDKSGHGGGGGSTCLVAGTKILMIDGTQKRIEDVHPGDKVMGYDTAHRSLKPETVLATDAPIRDHHYTIKLADGTSIGLTREHPLYSNKGWASIDPASTLDENASLHVAKLQVGDTLLEASGKYVAIATIVYVPGNVQTYNLKNVTGFNDFIAQGIVTHNKGGGGNSSGGGGGNASAM